MDSQDLTASGHPVWDRHWHRHRLRFILVTALFFAPPAYVVVDAGPRDALTNSIVLALFVVPLYLIWLLAQPADEKVDLEGFIARNGFSRFPSPPHYVDGRPFGMGYDHQYYDCITGKLSGHDFELFSYHFLSGTGRHPDENTVTVLALPLLNPTPAIYAKSLKPNLAVSLATEINPPWPVPDNATYLEFGNEFDKYYRIDIPAGSQIEALQIFQPALMDRLMQLPHPLDFELYGSTLYVYKTGVTSTYTELVALFAMASLLSASLDHDIDFMNYQPDLLKSAFSPQRFAVRYFTNMALNGLGLAAVIGGSIAASIGINMTYGTPGRLELSFGGIASFVAGAALCTYLAWRK